MRKFHILSAPDFTRVHFVAREHGLCTSPLFPLKAGSFSHVTREVYDTCNTTCSVHIVSRDQQINERGSFAGGRTTNVALMHPHYGLLELHNPLIYNKI